VIEPFEVRVPEAELDDLRDRIRRTRWPEAETDASQGLALARMRELCAHWADGYDWRATEARLNALPQFRTAIDGLGIHFIHARSARADALPLVLTHGWPGSVLEFLKVVEPLREDFHVVIPSLPGYGFSDKPGDSGWGVERIADAWVELMNRLGYERFGAAGSDWGTTVSTLIGSRATGIHLFPPLAPPVRGLEPTAREAAALADLADASGSGYSRVHATRPQTIGYALVDSPAGLLAWIGEKLIDWADVPLTDDEILDTVTLYWLTDTGASSARLYWESIEQVDEWISGAVTETVDVPTGCSVFPGELQRPSRRWAERRFTSIRHFNDELERGGHFAALEVPELFVAELRASFLA
jgi:pimeloyl-ACP methyl ester carboxylesterase